MATPLLTRPSAQDHPDLPPDQLPDISHMATTHDEHLQTLLAQWNTLSDQQKAQLVEEIQHAAQHGQLTDLTDLPVDSTATTAALAAAMTTIAALAATQVVHEAAEQGVELAAAHIPRAFFTPVAQVIATLLADELRITAARAVLQLGQDAHPAELADTARTALADLSDAGPRRQLGGALHGSMNVARARTFARAPVGALYACEVNDRNTCGPCREINGRWLGNTDDLTQVLATYPDGAYGGYIGCLGGINCRGTVVGVWRPKTTDGGQP